MLDHFEVNLDRFADNCIKSFETQDERFLVLHLESHEVLRNFVTDHLEESTKKSGYIYIDIDFYKQTECPVFVVCKALIPVIESLANEDQPFWPTQKSDLIACQHSNYKYFDTVSFMFLMLSSLLKHTNKEVILHIGELQHLAIYKKFDDILYAIRTWLTKNDSIHPIITSSDERNLQRLLKEQYSPFHRHMIFVQTFPTSFGVQKMWGLLIDTKFYQDYLPVDIGNWFNTIRPEFDFGLTPKQLLERPGGLNMLIKAIKLKESNLEP